MSRPFLSKKNKLKKDFLKFELEFYSQLKSFKNLY
jgi:hypothetical protein